MSAVHLVAGALVVGGIVSSWIQPAGGIREQAALLNGCYTAPTAGVHPFLITNAANETQFLTDAYATPSGAGAGKHQALIRLQVEVAGMLASSNSAVLAAIETPDVNTNGTTSTGVYATDMPVAQTHFSVYTGSNTTAQGAAVWALKMAYYAYLVNLSASALPGTSTGGFGTGSYAGLAAQAKAAANLIVYNWSTQGFRVNGQPITSFLQYTQSTCNAVAVATNSATGVATTTRSSYTGTGYNNGSNPPAQTTTTVKNSDGSTTTTVTNATCAETFGSLDTLQGVSLQVGRGMRSFVEAVDFLDDGSLTDKPATMGFIQNQEQMLIGAADRHYSFNTTRCGAYDNQASNTLATLSLLA